MSKSAILYLECIFLTIFAILHVYNTHCIGIESNQFYSVNALQVHVIRDKWDASTKVGTQSKNVV